MVSPGSDPNDRQVGGAIEAGEVVVLGDDGQCSRCRDGRNPQIVDPHPPTGLGEIDPQPRPRLGRFIIDWQRFYIRNLTIDRLESAAFEFIVEGPSHW